MCGIFGVINTKEKIDEGKVLAARDVLAHRGPDDAGVYYNKRHSELSEESPYVALAASRPDDSGVHNTNCHSELSEESPYVALAHRRLSIIDLSPAAHQPMTSEDGRFTIVYNGEIYNYLELRQKIKDQSKKLDSESDTEVILYLYAQYGKDCLKMLRGMFAFAIWDEEEKTLFAARDRFGIKPFYYYKSESEFVFASELNAIKNYTKNLTINNDALDAFLRTGSVPAPLTIYNEVYSLLPGQFIEIDCHPERGRRISINNYWKFTDLLNDHTVSVISAKGIPMEDDEMRRNLKDFSVASSFEMTKQGQRNTNKRKYDDEAKKKIREALLDTVRAHLVADVEVGAFLSGGIDSTAIVSLMRQVGQEKIKTVSVIFPGNKLDESKYARLAAKKYDTEHIEIPFYEKDLLDDFENIMSVMDQPTIDGINTYFVSKAAKQAGLKVVLSGLGGDELFGGYPSFNLIPKYQRIKNLPLAKMFMKAAAPLLKNKLPAKAIYYMKNPDEPNAEYKLVRGLFTDDELKHLTNGQWSIINDQLSPKMTNNVMTPDALTTNDSFTSNVISAEGIPTEDDPLRRNLKDFSVEDSFEMTTMQHISYLESCFYMRNQLLRDSDVFSMTHSLELRVPFVDHKLYEAVLPYLDDAYDKNFPKKLLVEAVGDLPDEIVHRQKMGFTFPFEDWIRNGQLKDLIIERLKNSNSELSLEHLPLNINKLHWSRLWSLFVLNRIREQ